MENWYWIPAIGWAVANSLWQTALCWLFYRLYIRLYPQSSAAFRHHLSLLLLTAAFGWFVATGMEYYAFIQLRAPQPLLNLPAAGNQLLTGISSLYLLFFLFHSAGFIRSLAGLQQLQSSAGLKAPVQLRIFAEQTALQLGIRQKIRLLLSDKVEVPSVLGILKPVLLLPVSACTRLSPAQLETVILHELAHIRRYDYLVNLLQSVLELFLFFNPFARLLGGVARKERENSCDDWVLNFQYDRQLYASALLTLEQNRRLPVQLAMAATNGKQALLQRIQRLFNTEPSVQLKSAQRIRLWLYGTGLSLLLLLSLPLLRPGMEKQVNSSPLPTAAVKISTGTDQRLSFQTALPGVLTLTEETVLQPARKKSLPVNNPARVSTVVPAEEPAFALINEELLADPAAANMQFIPASAGSGITEPLILKVEEEQSGHQQKVTYIAELRNDGGTPTLQPLILLRAPGKNNYLPADSSRHTKTDSIRNGVPRKKRITS